jgi:ribose 1,5-bisphosphokinase PhnN
MIKPSLSRSVIQAIDRLSAIRLSPHANISLPESLTAVVVVGSSASGKSTMIRALRDSQPSLRHRIVVPSRYITRAARPDDAHGENIHVSEAKFDALVLNGDICVHWTKRIDKRRERYGFSANAGTELPVYSGNNAILTRSSGLRPERILDSALVIAVYAPPRVRALRLAQRSPDLLRESPEYVRSRLQDDGVRVLQLSHLVVDNWGKSERVAAGEMVQLLEAICECY